MNNCAECKDPTGCIGCSNFEELKNEKIFDIKNLIKKAHKNACEKGFYDCPDPIHKKDDYQGYCSTCGGQNKDPSADIGEKLMLIVSEFGEAVDAHRKGRFSDKKILTCLIEDIGFAEEKMPWRHGFESSIKDTFEDEIADVFIRIFDLCGYLGIEPEMLNSYKISESIGTDLLFLIMNISQMWKYISLENSEIKKEFSFCAGDAIKFLLDFCKHHNIPIEKHIAAKMAYNKTRPKLHGKRY